MAEIFPTWFGLQEQITVESTRAIFLCQSNNSHKDAMRTETKLFWFHLTIILQNVGI